MASRYRMPPMAVAHEGGIFVTSTLADADPASVALRALNERVLTTFGLRRGASHTEFIHARDGSWQFLETSARVGGAYIVDVVEAASGLNLWREWAQTEIAGEGGSVRAAGRARAGRPGIVLSLARQEWPDTSGLPGSGDRRPHPQGRITPGWSSPRPSPAASHALLERLRRAIPARLPRLGAAARAAARLMADAVLAEPHAAGAGARLVAAARERARHRHLPAAVVRPHPAALSGDLHAGRPEPRRSGARVRRHVGAAAGARRPRRARPRDDRRRHSEQRRGAAARVQPVSGRAPRRRRRRRLSRVHRAHAEAARSIGACGPGRSARRPASSARRWAA